MADLKNLIISMGTLYNLREMLEIKIDSFYPMCVTPFRKYIAMKIKEVR